MKKLLLLLAMTVFPVLSMSQTRESLNVVVTFPVGTGSDVLARQWVKKYDELFGTTSVVINKPGGEGIIGFKYFATLKEQDNSIPILWPAMGHVLVYNEPDKDQYVPLIELTRTPWILIARKDFSANTFKELVAYAKSNPGKVNQGVQPPIWGNMINSIAQANGISVNFIPYNARPELDVAGGTLDTAWVSPGSIIGTGLESKVKIIATTSVVPLREYPNIENGTNPAIGEWYIYGGPFVNASLPTHLKEVAYKRFEFMRGLPWAQELGAKTHAQIPANYTGKDYAKDIKSLSDRFAKTQQKTPKK